jgi:hypothetical protein
MVRDKNNEWVITPAGETGRFLSTFAEAANGEIYAGTWLPNHGTNNAIYQVVAEGN